MTRTAPASIVVSTTTITVPYTDIIVSTSTAFSTVDETLTSSIQVFETVTDFTATSVSTVTTQATAPAVTYLKKRGPKRKRCKVKSTQTSTSTPSEPSLDSTTVSASSAPSTTSSPAPLFPIASQCLNLEQYSSACSCIWAVSGTTIQTYQDPASTSVVSETITSTATPSVSTSIVTVIVTESVTSLVTTTATTTVGGIQDATTTVTSTTTPFAATQTAHLRTVPLNRLITVSGQYVQYDYSNTGIGATLEVVTATGRVNLVGQPSITLWVRTPTVNYGVLWFQAASGATASDQAVTCFPDSSGSLTCAATGGAFNTVFSCGAYMYLGRSTWTQAGCTKVTFKLSTT